MDPKPVPIQPLVATPPQRAEPMTPPVVYAGFWRRFGAVILDAVILGFLNLLISLPIGIVFGVVVGVQSTATGTSADIKGNPLFLVMQLVITLLQLAVNLGYALYFIGNRGQTLGKMAMGIKVVKLDTNDPPGYVGAFLREVVGKLLSSLALGLGYLWMLWDDKKQTCHDKIAGTVVVKI